jgi:hypothetical protein
MTASSYLMSLMLVLGRQIGMTVKNRRTSRNLFFYETALPSVAVGVDFHYFFVGVLLDFLAMGRGEVGDAHDKVSGDGVKTG